VRLFVAVDIDDAIRRAISTFLDSVRGLAPDARWVRPESLHITLKFIGEQQEERLGAVKERLSSITGSSLRIAFRGFGFFPSAKSARVFWLGMESGTELGRLAGEIDRAMESLGIEKEKREYSPHLTLARGEGRSGAPGWRKGDKANKVFLRLQEKLAGMSPPDFGTMTAGEFFLFQSKLQRGGAQYTKLARYELSDNAS
jgi:RNA 2',3'-cyclic 3'-phosphodiesterase